MSLEQETNEQGVCRECKSPSYTGHMPDCQANKQFDKHRAEVKEKIAEAVMAGNYAIAEELIRGLRTNEEFLAGTPRPNQKEVGGEQQEFQELRVCEQEKLREFFGYGIDVPPLPDEITHEKYEQWKELGFELHYLPDEDLTKDRDLPGWEKKPNNWFYDRIGDGRISADATKLAGAWILADNRAKPAYIAGNQMYENDSKIGKCLKELREQYLLKKCRTSVQSRSNLTWDELHRPRVRQALADVFGVALVNIRLPKAIESNYLGNAFHKEWGGTEPLEWFEDSYDNGRERLFGGNSSFGGLSHIASFDPTLRNASVGFRPLVVFSRTKA